VAFAAFDDRQRLTKSAGVVAIILSHMNIWIQPEFRFHIVFFDVNMYRLMRRSLVGIEEEPESALAEDYWHNVRSVPVDLS
jgi:hypothetical protein